MSVSKTVISKRPNLITTVPNDSTYKDLSQSQLLAKVKLLHEQLLKTNKYLMEVHRMSIYNWDENDTGNIIVELPESKKGFLLDAVVRLRGIWDPATNTPELLGTDLNKIGWLYRVDTEHPITLFGKSWKKDDYALYDEQGVLYNVQTQMLESLFTPIMLIESDTIQFDQLPQTSQGIQIRGNVKLNLSNDNDITATAEGLYSEAYKKAKALITIQEVAPTGDNLEGGLRIVYLQTRPETFYNGWLYLIPPATINVEN